MLIEKAHQIDAVVSSDATRPALCHVFVDENKAYASDGHVVAQVPVEIEIDDKTSSCLVPAEAFAISRSLNGGKTGQHQMLLTEEGVTLPSGWRHPAMVFDSKYLVTMRGAFPSRNKKPVASMCINTKRLATLAKALGEDVVTLRLHDDGRIEVIGDGLARGMMPQSG